MTDLAATSQLYSSRPRVLVDGAGEETLDQGLISLSVEESTAGLYCCEACFGNWGSVGGTIDYLFFDRSQFDFGREVAFEIGEGDAAAEVFAGRISALEGRFPIDRPPEFQLLAEDRLQDLRMARRSRTFEDVSDSDLFATIASEHGLSSDLDIEGPTYSVVAQVNQSDLALLRERARTIDAEVWIEGSTLRAQARSRRNNAELTLTYGQRLREFSVSADLTHQRTKLVVSGWDTAAKETLAEEAGEDTFSGELDGEGGASVLEEAFGERTEQLVHCVPHTVEEARSLAEAHYRKMARGFLRGRGVAEGDGRLRVGSHVELAELGPLFDGEYYVTHVQHSFSEGAGFRTAFSVERPWLGAA